MFANPPTFGRLPANTFGRLPEPMQRLCVSSVVLALLVPLAPTHAQARTGPSIAAGLAWGRQSNNAYSTTDWGGFHVSLTLPVRRTRAGAAVLDITRDVFWKGDGDDCVIRPPDSACLPDPPSVTALTIGWRHSIGRSYSLYVGAGRMSGRGQAAGGGVARFRVTMPTAFGAEIFGQYTIIPAFLHVTYQTAIWGLTLYAQ